MDLKPIFSTADFANSSETCEYAARVAAVHVQFLIRLSSTAPLLKLIGLTTRYVELCETLVKEAIIWEAWRACGADKEREGLEQPMIQSRHNPSLSDATRDVDEQTSSQNLSRPVRLSPFCTLAPWNCWPRFWLASRPCRRSCHRPITCRKDGCRRSWMTLRWISWSLRLCWTIYASWCKSVSVPLPLPHYQLHVDLFFLWCA